MDIKNYVIEFLTHSYVSFYEEFQAQNFDDAMKQAKQAYPDSELYNVYISANSVSKSQGGNYEQK